MHAQRRCHAHTMREGWVLALGARMCSTCACSSATAAAARPCCSAPAQARAPPPPPPPPPPACTQAMPWAGSNAVGASARQARVPVCGSGGGGGNVIVEMGVSRSAGWEAPVHTWCCHQEGGWGCAQPASPGRPPTCMHPGQRQRQRQQEPQAAEVISWVKSAGLTGLTALPLGAAHKADACICEHASSVHMHTYARACTCTHIHTLLHVFPSSCSPTWQALQGAGAVSPSLNCCSGMTCKTAYEAVAAGMLASGTTCMQSWGDSEASLVAYSSLYT